MTELQDLRYPIGRFTPPASSDPASRSGHIEVLRALPERLRAAVHSLSSTQLDTPYRDGGWTVRQLVHHIADSHANAYVRYKLASPRTGPPSSPTTKRPGPDSPIAFFPSMALSR